jgi:hypothetical protein
MHPMPSHMSPRLLFCVGVMTVSPSGISSLASEALIAVDVKPRVASRAAQSPSSAPSRCTMPKRQVVSYDAWREATGTSDSD